MMNENQISTELKRCIESGRGRMKKVIEIKDLDNRNITHTFTLEQIFNTVFEMGKRSGIAKMKRIADKTEGDSK